MSVERTRWGPFYGQDGGYVLQTYRFEGEETEEAHFEAAFGGEWVPTRHAWATVNDLQKKLSEAEAKIERVKAIQRNLAWWKTDTNAESVAEELDTALGDAEAK